MKKFGQTAIAERSARRILHSIDPSTPIGAREWFERMLRKARTEGVFMVEETLTAPLARLLLDINDANRNVIKSSVKEMAGAMKAGSFDAMNGETIKISLCGQLNDGQHRCHARLEAGTDIRMRFMFGLPREGRLTIDQGRQRRSSDYLAMRGYASGAVIASVAAMLYLWRNERAIRSKRASLSRSRVAEYAQENYEQIMASYSSIPRKGVTYIASMPLIVFSHLLFSEIDPSGANDFITRLVRGEGLEEDSPILALRQRMISGRRISVHERFELIIRAWNAYRAKEKKAYFQIRGIFPEISK